MNLLLIIEFECLFIEIITFSIFIKVYLSENIFLIRPSAKFNFLIRQNKFCQITSNLADCLMPKFLPLRYYWNLSM